jgi:flagellin-like hook-associated protein FlgL
MLEANPPAGRTVTARVTSRGLEIQLDAAGGGQLTVSEVGGGTTAAELGIKSDSAIGTGPLVGGDLNPVLRGTTRLADILGERASVRLTSPSSNNDLVIESLTNGPGDNGVAIQYVNDALLRASGGLTAGNETVSYTPVATAASAAVSFSGPGNNLVLTGTTAGTSLNNVQIVIEDAGAIGNAAQVVFDATAGVLRLRIDSSGATEVQTLTNAIDAEGTFTAAHDPSAPADGPFNPSATISAADVGVVTGNTGNSGAAANTFLVSMEPGGTTANHVVAALSGDSDFASRFTVRLDGKDTSSPAFAGAGLIDVNSGGITSGGSGEALDLASGLLIRNGPNTYAIEFSAAETVEELLNVLNGSGANVLAEINASGTGINIRSRLSGTDLFIGENGGATATQLGVRSLDSATSLAELNYGQGVEASGGVDFTILRTDGVALDINLAGANTIADVIDLINNHPNNTGDVVVARLAQFGNGIELIDANPAPTGPLVVEQSFTSRAAEELGLVAKGETIAAAAPGNPAQLISRDVNPIEVRGVFNALIRMRKAIDAGDQGALERAAQLLDEAFEVINFSRAEIGARGQALDVLATRLEDEEVELKKNLSDEIEVDMTEAISSFTARQAAYQATLQLSGRLFQLSLLDYL